MKKLLGILVLAFILNSCATPDDTYSSLLNEPHNALAKSSNGTFGMSWKRKNIEHAVFSALATCDNYGTGCVLEKINGSRVTPQEATEWRDNFNRNKKYLTIGSGVRGTFVITSDTGERDKESKKDNPAEERNKLLISCFKDNRETSIKLKITECEAYADGEAVDIGDDSGNPVWERPDWYSLNICKKKKIKECEIVGKNLYLYNSIVKRDLKIGPVVGVVYLKKGQDRGTNQVRLAEKNSYYYLIDDMGDKNNLLTVLLVKEHSFK